MVISPTGFYCGDAVRIVSDVMMTHAPILIDAMMMTLVL